MAPIFQHPDILSQRRAPGPRQNVISAMYNPDVKSQATVAAHTEGASAPGCAMANPRVMLFY
jgi:hypothetical protein